MTFPALPHDRVVEEVFHLPIVEHNANFVHGLLPGAKFGVDALPGFPTVHTIPVSSFIAKHSVRVFTSASMNESVVLTFVGNQDQQESHDALALKLLGRRAYVGWPYLMEAVVCGVSDTVFEWTLKDQQANTYQR